MFWLFLACAHSVQVPISDTNPSTTGSSRQGLSNELVVAGPLSERLSPDDQASLVILYGGEERGSLDECGCPHRPRGGLARQKSYFDALQESNSPVLFVNGGYWLQDATSLDGTPRADVPVSNQWMVEGLKQLAPDALNVSYNDTGGLNSLEAPPPGLPLVSANIVGETISPYVLLEAGPHTIGITGITTPGMSFLEPENYQITDPVKGARPILEEMESKADFIILLAYGDAKAAKKLAESGTVDVVIDTQLHRENYPPVFVGGALWVRSHFQTMRLGELRLGIEDGEIVWAHERKVDLDERIPDDSELATITKTARREIKAVQIEAFGREL